MGRLAWIVVTSQAATVTLMWLDHLVHRLPEYSPGVSRWLYLISAILSLGGVVASLIAGRRFWA